MMRSGDPCREMSWCLEELEITLAITVQAPAAEVWSQLMQIGC